MNQIIGNTLLISLISGISAVVSSATVAAEVPKSNEIFQLQKPEVQPSNAQAVASVTTSEITIVDVNTFSNTNLTTQQTSTTRLEGNRHKDNAISSNVAVQQDATSVKGSTQRLAQVTSVSQLTNSQSTESLAQVTSVSQLSDVQPTDWAFQALQSLVERYGCIAGYPDRTYRGNRALTRYEFAAGLNACLERVNELIATATADLKKRRLSHPATSASRIRS